MSEWLLALEGYAASANTLIRGLIAGVVIFVSYRLAAGPSGIFSAEWEAVLLVVIGYYFKDRPREDALVASLVRQREQEMTEFEAGPKDSHRGVLFEMLVQFVLALALIVFTILAFLEAQLTNISGAWIGAVVLAVGFYFKDTHSPFHGAHELFRTILAAAVAGSTLVFVTPALFSPRAVPLQWVGVVFIVIAFYFKEKSGPNPYEWVRKEAR